MIGIPVFVPLIRVSTLMRARTDAQKQNKGYSREIGGRQMGPRWRGQFGECRKMWMVAVRFEDVELVGMDSGGCSQSVLNSKTKNQ